MNKDLKKIIESEKEDLNTVKKLLRGESVKPRFSFKDLNVLKVLADNWLFTIILIAFLIGGFFLGAVSFEAVCNDALIECQDQCNEFYGVGDSKFTFDDFNPETTVLPSEPHQKE